MSTPADRIPVPWPQRWELVRERLLPAAVLAATLAACGWLWRQQLASAPNAVGEVHGRAVDVISPCDGEVQPIDPANGNPWPLFATVDRGQIVARVKDRADGDTVVELRSPLAGQIVAAPATPGQLVREGHVLVKVASGRPDYIVCRLADPWQTPPAAGAAAAVRQRGRDARWHATVVEAVGPVVESAPAAQGPEALAASRGLPVRLALPADVELAPGSIVEVRFPPASP